MTLRREVEKGLNDTEASRIWALLGFGAKQSGFLEGLGRQRGHCRGAPCEIENPFIYRGLVAAAAALKQLIAASEEK